jgi:outer membrane protein insertion porin family
MNLIRALEIITSSFRRKFRYFLIIGIIPVVLSGCIGTRYLPENKKLLYKQSIKAPKGFVKDGLSDLYIQKANSRFLALPITPLVGLHHAGEKRYDRDKYVAKKEALQQKFDAKIAATTRSTKIASLQYRKQRKMESIDSKIENGNLFMQWGEPVSIFDSSVINYTTEKIQAALFNRGYFLSRTKAELKEYKKRVSIVYELFPGVPYVIDTIIFNIPDTVVLGLVKKSQPASALHKTDPYNQDNINAERDRIELLLKDKGYYDFSKEYIDFQIDTSYKAVRKIAIKMEIQNPAQRDNHKVFTVDSLIFTPDAGAIMPAGVPRQTQRYRNITYNYYKDQYSQRILSQRIFIAEDSTYSRTNTLNTQRQLANLDIFKFVNINYDTAGGRFIANVFSSPQDLYSLSNEAGLKVTQGYPGPYYSASLKKRNLFGGLEIFELSGRVGIEGVASATSDNEVYGSVEAGVNASLTFPIMLFPFSSKQFFKQAKYNPKTKLQTGYAYTDRPEYKRSLTSLSATYTWEPKRTLSYSFTPINLNIVRTPFMRTDFYDLLIDLQENEGNNLINSFKPSFVTSMIFSLIWNPNNYSSYQKNSFFARLQFESGGTLFNFFEPDRIINEGLQVYKYLRASADVRRNQILGERTVMAFRFNSGVSYAYGKEDEDKILPYEKYFFAGGSNGVRAWKPRRLGVGSTPPAENEDPVGNGRFDYSYEKPGELLLEGSVELRRKIFGFVNGAVFVDMGNVWALRTTGTNDQTTTSSKFDIKKFYKEFGVGTGFGLRFDFSFLILRLDVGVKAYDPAYEEGNRFVLDRVSFFKPYAKETAEGTFTNYKEPVTYNIGIGYPF